MQTSQSGASVGQVFRSVVATDGVFGLFRGIQSPMAGLVAMNALVFQSFGWAKQALGERQGVELSVQRLFVAGSIAGAAITIAEGLFLLFLLGRVFFSFAGTCFLLICCQVLLIF